MKEKFIPRLLLYASAVAVFVAWRVGGEMALLIAVPAAIGIFLLNYLQSVRFCPRCGKLRLERNRFDEPRTCKGCGAEL